MSDGDEIIEREAKKLISSGLHKVTRNMSAFSYLFGREELKRAMRYAFDYTYKKFEIGGRRDYHSAHFNSQVFDVMEKVAMASIVEYRKYSREEIKSIEFVYPTGRDLERIVRSNEGLSLKRLT